MAQIVIILDDESVETDPEHFSGLTEEEYKNLTEALEEYTVIDVKVMASADGS